MNVVRCGLAGLLLTCTCTFAQLPAEQAASNPVVPKPVVPIQPSDKQRRVYKSGSPRVAGACAHVIDFVPPENVDTGIHQGKTEGFDSGMPVFRSVQICPDEVRQLPQNRVR